MKVLAEMHREGADAKLPGKAASDNLLETVPQTDTGRRVENTKAMRELG
jgi:hypothetical protein